MAKTIANLNIKLSAGTATLQRDLQRAGGTVQGFGNQVRSLGSSLAGLAARAAALAGIGSIGASFGWGIKLAADAEQAQVAFEVLLGSATKAQTLLSELRDFAASTPFEFPELRDAGRSLVAFGESAENVPDTLRRIGDIASGISQPIGEIAQLYGKARVQGRLFQEDINQLTGRGIPIIQQLAKQFGVADSEVRKLTESGQISFANLEQAFIDMTATGGQFAGMMEKQSQTLAGRWSTLKDSVAALALSMGEKLLPAAGKIVESLSGLVQWLGNLDSSFVLSTLQVVAFAGSFATVMLVLPKVIFGLKALQSALKGMAAVKGISSMFALGPMGIAISAGALAVGLLTSAFDKAAVAADGVTKNATAAAVAVDDVGKAADNLLGKTREPVSWKITINGEEQILKSAAALRVVEDAAKPGVSLDFRPGEILPAVGRMLGIVNSEAPRAARAVASVADAVTGVSDAAKKASDSLTKIGSSATAASFPVQTLADDVARAMAPLSDGVQTLEKLRKAGKAFTDSMMSPVEKLESELEKINTLLANRVITEETASRGREKLRADYEAALESAKQIEAIERRLENVGSAQRGSGEDLAAINAAQRRLADMQFAPLKVEVPKVEIPGMEPPVVPVIPGFAEMQARLDAEYSPVPREVESLKTAGEKMREMVQKQQEMARKQDAANASLEEIAKNTKDTGVTVKEVDL